MGMREWKDGKWVRTSGGFVIGGGLAGSGIHIGPDEPTDENVDVWIDTDEEAGESGDTAAQPDWNADEKEQGHVLNRTHYTSWKTVVSERTETPDNNGFMAFPSGFVPVVGTIYKVTWNGTDYECKCYKADGAACIGNITGETIEPFGIAYLGSETDSLIAVLDGSASVTYSIKSKTVIQIPEEYLPEVTRVYTVVVPNGEIDTNTTTWGLSESGDEAAKVLYQGGRVWLDLATETGAALAKTEVIGFNYFVSEQGNILTCSVIYNKNIVSVLFAAGTWTPPTT